MTRSEMLRRMGLTEEEFKHLMSKFKSFYVSLNARQKAVIKRSLPSLEQAAKSFGTDVKVEDMQQMFDTDNSGGSFNSEIAGQVVNDGDADDE